MMTDCATPTGLSERDQRVRGAAPAAPERPGQGHGDPGATAPDHHPGTPTRRRPFAVPPATGHSSRHGCTDSRPPRFAYAYADTDADCWCAGDGRAPAPRTPRPPPRSQIAASGAGESRLGATAGSAVGPLRSGRVRLNTQDRCPQPADGCPVAPRLRCSTPAITAHGSGRSCRTRNGRAVDTDSGRERTLDSRVDPTGFRAEDEGRSGRRTGRRVSDQVRISDRP